MAVGFVGGMSALGLFPLSLLPWPLHGAPCAPRQLRSLCMLSSLHFRLFLSHIKLAALDKISSGLSWRCLRFEHVKLAAAEAHYVECARPCISVK